MQREAAEPKGTNRCVVGERRECDGRPVGMLHHRVAGRDRGEDVPVSDNDEAGETALRVGIALARDVVAKVCGNDLRVFEMVLANVDLHVGHHCRELGEGVLRPSATALHCHARPRRAVAAEAAAPAPEVLRAAARLVGSAVRRRVLLMVASVRSESPLVHEILRVKLMEARVAAASTSLHSPS